jgi:hypothetical protein
MDDRSEGHRTSEDALRLTPRQRLERFAELQRRAMRLLAASPDGYRRYWERNLRQRRTDAKS